MTASSPSEACSSARGPSLVQKSIIGFLSGPPTYTPSAEQQAALGVARRAEIRIDPDGDCLFAALVAMGVTAADGTTFASSTALRTYVAAGVRGNSDLRVRLLFAHYNPATVADPLATPRSWLGLTGDIAPEMIATTLGIQLRIMNNDGTTTIVGTGTAYLRIRFNRTGGEHYHGTRAAV